MNQMTAGFGSLNLISVALHILQQEGIFIYRVLCAELQRGLAHLTWFSMIQ